MRDGVGVGDVGKFFRRRRRRARALGPGPWARALGPGPMGPGPWARALGPGPLGPGPWASRTSREKTSSQNGVCLVGKLSGHLGRVFLDYLEAPSSHIRQNIFRTDLLPNLINNRHYPYYPY